MADPTPWIRAFHASHDRLTGLLSPLSGEQVQGPSYDDDWSIAQVASHLGSQSEIFGLFLDAGLAGTPAPGGEVFAPIWDRWNAASPPAQVADSLAANAAYTARVEGLTPAQRDSFALAAFGSELDLAGMLELRLNEHALHTWDVAVALDPGAVVSADAVSLLVPGLPQRVAQVGKPVDGTGVTPIRTTDPARSYTLTLGSEVTLVETDAPGPDALELPAEALVRLVNGRLDVDHTPARVVDDSRLPALRLAFPGV